MKKEFQIIAGLIENHTNVLDVGCGDGTLMKYLKDEKKSWYKRTRNIKK